MSQPVEILFPQGLPGFEDLRTFVISEVADTPFYYLESTEQPETTFLLLNPFAVTKSYEFEVPETVKETLATDDPAHLAVFNIVNTSQGIQKATVNLQAPVIINVTKSKGVQVVLNEPALNIREPLHNLVQGAVEK